ncbi:ExbD/TolR family protein [Massilia putida]|uniref:ExbD/TolR family protein n=1 Tax=Massilia putida TaxID=1141883 RepID=UPI0009527011|nr:biopolymer transporter ExbD [Massilia putida]
MQLQEENAPFDDINVTPMLDLAYVLLVIFIIMTTASVQGVKVKLPKAKMTASMAKSHLKAVTISENGDIFLDAYPVTLDALGPRLEELKRVNPSQAMVLKGDAHAQYLKVMQVLELMKRADITDIGLVTSKAGA